MTDELARALRHVYPEETPGVDRGELDELLRKARAEGYAEARRELRREFIKSDLMTITEAAGYLTCSVRTVNEEHAKGRLAFVKIASRTRIRRAELERYLKARERVAA